MRRFLVKSNGYKPGALTPYQYIFELNESSGQLKLYAGNKEYIVNGSGGGDSDFDPDLYYTISDIDGMDLANSADLVSLSNDLIDSAPEMYNTIGKISNWITNNVDNENYATKEFVTESLGEVTLFSFEVVSELPTEDIKTNSIYLLPNNTSGDNIYDEYIYVNGSWEVIGSTSMDLSGYVTEDWVNNQGFLTTYTDTVTSVGATTQDAVSGTVVINGTGATQVTQSGNTITINSTNTNTTYTAGTNVSIDGTVISATDTNTEYTAGAGISIVDEVISNTSPNVVQTLSLDGDDITLSDGGGIISLDYISPNELDSAIESLQNNILYFDDGTEIVVTSAMNNSILLVEFDGNVDINIPTDEVSYNFVVRNIHETGTVTFTGMTPHGSSTGGNQIVGYGMASVIKYTNILIITNP